jgi:SAM-dependent methyltransferase
VEVTGTPDDAWAELADRFVDGHYGTLRGLVRTHVIHEHLRVHFPPPPVSLVDVGGGAGNQSIPLARAGYEVTLLDPSPSMLARAERRVAAEEHEVARRIRLVQARGEDALAALEGEVFGGVMCHGVLMYVDDPEPLVSVLCRLCQPGGVLSIVAKNVKVMAARPALQEDWAAAMAAFDSSRQVNGLGVDTRGDSVEALSTLLADNGAEPMAWYGVRLFTDGWLPDRAPSGPQDLVLQVELEASRRDPYRQLSRLFHLVGRRH